MKICVYAISKKKPICGIYAVTHIESGRVYIGKSVNSHVRWNEHVRECRNYNNKFYNALAKYGRRAFTWEIIEECPRELLNDREKFWIAKLDTIKNGLNCTIGGDGVMVGFKHSAEERAAKSARQRGKPHSAEHNRRVSAALMGHHVSENTLSKLRANAESRRGTKVIFSEQHRKAISLSKIGKKNPPELYENMWKTRRARYGNTGLSVAGLASISTRAKTLVLSRWGTK